MFSSITNQNKLRVQLDPSGKRKKKTMHFKAINYKKNIETMDWKVTSGKEYALKQP